MTDVLPGVSPRRRPALSGAVLTAAFLLGLAALMLSAVLVRGEDPFGFGVLSSAALGLLGLAVLAGATARSGTVALAVAAAAVIVGGTLGAGLELAGRASQERADRATADAEQQRQGALRAGAAPLTALILQCGSRQLAVDAATPVRGAALPAADRFAVAVAGCVVAASDAAQLQVTCDAEDRTCTMPVGTAGDSTASFAAVVEQFVIRRREALSAGSFQERYGDRCTAGEVDPYAPGASFQDCAAG